MPRLEAETQHMIELAPDDPAERAAYIAACESAEFCHAFGLGLPDFRRMVSYHSHRLHARREFSSTELDSIEHGPRVPSSSVALGAMLIIGFAMLLYFALKH
jgi:hypothetical protein